MILYDNRGYVQIFLRLSGSLVFSKPVVVPSIVSSILCVVVFQFPEPMHLTEQLEWPAWVFSTALAFAIIFRTALAYRRFWNGISSSVAMLSTWRSAFTNLLGFTDSSIREHQKMGNKAIIQELQHSKKIIGHWFSMLFAVAVQTLQWREEPCELGPMSAEEALQHNITAFWSAITEEEKYDRVYISSASTHEERAKLGAAFDKLSQIIQWIENEVARLHLFKRLLIDAPILTRIFEDLSNGALAYCEAHMIAFIPFPFLFAQVLNWMLIIFVVVCPFIVQAAAAEREGGLIQEPMFYSWPALVVMNGLLVAGFSGLNEIAVELEDPFREKLNNFPIRALQRRVDLSLGSINREVDHDAPVDFTMERFGDELQRYARGAEDRAIRCALAGGPSSSSAPAAVLPIVKACDELRLALSSSAKDLGKNSDTILSALRDLELETCELAYRVIQAQNNSSQEGNGPGRPNASLTAHPWRSECGYANSSADSSQPAPVAPVAGHSSAATGASGDTEVSAPARAPSLAACNELRDLLEQSADVNRRLCPLLIHAMCFGTAQNPNPGRVTRVVG